MPENIVGAGYVVCGVGGGGVCVWRGCWRRELGEVLESVGSCGCYM